jgi:hypothetical protein
MWGLSLPDVGVISASILLATFLRDVFPMGYKPIEAIITA